MKLLTSILLMFVAVVTNAATFANYYTTNANPAISTAGTNSVNWLINQSNLVEQAFVTNSANYLINQSNLVMQQFVTNSANYLIGQSNSVVQTGITNSILALDNRLFFEAQDQNLVLSNVAYRVRAGKPLRIMNYGDDAWSPQSATQTILNKYLTWNGTISGDGGTFYADLSAGVTQNTLNSYVPIYIYGLPAGGGITNRLHPLSDTITFGYYAMPGFNPLVVTTNNGTGGTEGVVATIDGSSATPQLLFTNLTLPAGTWRASVTSPSGTNAVLFVGQHLEASTNYYLWDIWQNANTDLINAMTNSFWSNSLVTLAGQYDLMVVNCSDQPYQTTNGWPLFWNAMTNRYPLTTPLFVNPAPDTNDLAGSYYTRIAAGKVGYEYGAPVFDAGHFFFPVNPTLQTNLYKADGVHLSTAGDLLPATALASLIVNPFQNKAVTSVASASSTNYWGSNSVTGNLTNSGLGVRVLGPNGFGATNDTIADGQFLRWSTNGVLTNNGPVGVSGSLTVVGGLTNANQKVTSASTSLDGLWVTGGSSLEANANSGGIVLGDTTTPLSARFTLGRNTGTAFIDNTWNNASSAVKIRLRGTSERFNILDTYTESIKPFRADSTTVTNGYFGDSLQLFNRTTVPTNAIGTGGSNVTVLNLGTNLVAIWTNVAAGGYNTNWLTGKTLSASTANTPVVLSDSTPANVVSLTLTPGTWRISAHFKTSFSGATATLLSTGISTTSATLPTAVEDLYNQILAIAGSSLSQSVSIPSTTVTITADTTYYLVGQAAFTVGSAAAYGQMWAVRAF